MNIRVIAPINPITGYHKLISGACNALANRGHSVQLFPRGVEFEYGWNSAPDVQKFIVHNRDGWKTPLLIDGILERPQVENAIRFTMWESTEISDEIREMHSKNRVTIFPCEWNIRKLRFKRMEHCPLGVDPLKYHWYPQQFAGKFVFGVAGRMKGFRERKDLFATAEWFTRAFPRETDVELWIKGFPDDTGLPNQHPFDKRIRIIKCAFSEQQWIKWLSNVNVFVSSSFGEGWGLCQHEAMALGRPTIMPNYGGLSEFFTPLGNYGVEYSERPVKCYHYRGNVCDMHMDSIVDAMRYAYNNPQDVVQRGLHASNDAGSFTWERTAIKLEKILKKYEH